MQHAAGPLLDHVPYQIPAPEDEAGHLSKPADMPDVTGLPPSLVIYGVQVKDTSDRIKTETS